MIPFFTIIHDYWSDEDGDYKAIIGIEVEYFPNVYYPHYLDNTIN